MKTFVYIKQYGTTPLDVAHIYEHLFINSFKRYAAGVLNIDRALVEYMGGQTLRGLVTIEAWLYSPEMVRIFEDFIKHEAIDMSRLDIIVSQVAAEDTRSIKITYTLEQEIHKLSLIPWQNVADASLTLIEDETDDNNYLEDKEKSARFKTALVTCYASLDELSVEERALFQRLSSVVLDILIAYIEDHGWYQLNSSTTKEDDSYASRSFTFTAPQKSFRNTELEASLEKTLSSFNIKLNYPAIKAHFQAYALTGVWVGSAIERLKNSNILVSNKDISMLASEARIKHLFSKLQIRVETISRQTAIDMQN